MNTNHAFDEFNEIISVTDNFMDVAEPFLNIVNEKDYEATLTLIESLMSRADKPENERFLFLLKLLGDAVNLYEDTVPELAAFKLEAENIPADIATLRILMDQHGLGVKDLPEIGTKGYISKILSGERNLTKQHIQKLSTRFNISPALFFN